MYNQEKEQYNKIIISKTTDLRTHYTQVPCDDGLIPESEVIKIDDHPQAIQLPDANKVDSLHDFAAHELLSLRQKGTKVGSAVGTSRQHARQNYKSIYNAQRYLLTVLASKTCISEYSNVSSRCKTSPHFFLPFGVFLFLLTGFHSTTSTNYNTVKQNTPPMQPKPQQPKKTHQKDKPRKPQH